MPGPELRLQCDRENPSSQNLYSKQASDTFQNGESSGENRTDCSGRGKQAGLVGDKKEPAVWQARGSGLQEGRAIGNTQRQR